MTIRAALLDADGVFVRMDTLADARQLTARHLPKITSCDLKPGTYRWVPDPANSYGGAFWPIQWLEQRKADEAAIALSLRKQAELEQVRALPAGARRAARAALRAARMPDSDTKGGA